MRLTAPTVLSAQHKILLGVLSLVGVVWPKGSNGYLVWFVPNWRDYHYTIDELRNIANLQLIIQASDGEIYRV